MPTLSNIPPERANAVVVVVVVVVVDVAGRRNAKEKIQRTAWVSYCLSLVLHAMDIYLTSETILDQYATELSFSRLRFMDSSM